MPPARDLAGLCFRNDVSAHQPVHTAHLLPPRLSGLHLLARSASDTGSTFPVIFFVPAFFSWAFVAREAGSVGGWVGEGVFTQRGGVRCWAVGNGRPGGHSGGGGGGGGGGRSGGRNSRRNPVLVAFGGDRHQAIQKGRTTHRGRVRVTTEGDLLLLFFRYGVAELIPARSWRRGRR